MVVYSKEIKEFLDKLFFYDLTHGKEVKFPLYGYYEDKLYNIDKISKHLPSSTFPMLRDGLFGITIGRLEFGYSFDGENAYVQYCINCNPQNDKFDWLIKESKTDINDNVKDNLLESALSLMERMDNLYK